MGMEVEYSVLSGEFSQATELCRDQIVKSNPDFADVELGAAQLEWRGDPLYLNQVGLNALENIFIVNEEKIKESVREQGAHLLRTGSNPFVLIPEIKRTIKPAIKTPKEIKNRLFFISKPKRCASSVAE